MQHPRELGAEHIEKYLTHLAVNRNVSASTQNLALSALLFLYKQVLEIELPKLDGVTRAKKSTRVPVVFTADEASQVIQNLQPPFSLMAKLQYGSGLRLMECVRLRVKDIDFEYKTITVRDGKGRKDRVTLLPDSAVDDLKFQLGKSKELHAFDQQAGYGRFLLLQNRHTLPPVDNIRTVQELMGHKDIRTTQIYTHVLERGGNAVKSPLDSFSD